MRTGCVSCEMSNVFLKWLDRYIHVDRINLRPNLVLPRMRWWEWPWYVAVIACGAVLMPYLEHWLDQLVQPVPVLHYVPFVVTWPVLGLLYGAGAYVLLPARAARAAAVGEGWLIGFIWLLTGLASLMWSGPAFRSWRLP